jgi:protein-disulfide isomerase
VSALNLNRVILFLAATGIFVAGTLSLGSLFNLSVPCGVGGGCDAVTNDPLSKWFGIPVAYWGFGAYLILAILALVRPFLTEAQSRMTLNFGVVFSGLGMLASVLLQVHSVVNIQAICPWCLASAAIMVLMFLAQIWMREADLSTLVGKNDWAVHIVILFVAVGALGFQAAQLRDAGSEYLLPAAQIAHLKKEDLIPENPNSIGPEDAAITIVEFADFLCPGCKAAAPRVKQFQAENPDKVRIVYRHYPLYAIPGHQQSINLAVVAEYAKTQGKFWEFAERISTSTRNPGTQEEVLAIAREIGLNMDDVRKELSDINSPSFQRAYADLKAANDLGLNFTPTFFVFIEGEPPKGASTWQGLEAILSSGTVQRVLSGG